MSAEFKKELDRIENEVNLKIAATKPLIYSASNLQAVDNAKKK